MIIGDKSRFAIETHIECGPPEGLYGRVGYFNIFIMGQRYGLNDPRATVLDCSYDAIVSRIESRGRHSIYVLNDMDASKMAVLFRELFYVNGADGPPFLGARRDELIDQIHENSIVMAPDGDQAFDDGSYILQLDVGDSVRLIGFKSNGNIYYDKETLAEFVIDANSFYGLLLQWCNWYKSKKLTGS